MLSLKFISTTPDNMHAVLAAGPGLTRESQEFMVAVGIKLC